MLKRMAKGWTLVATNALEFGDTETRAEKARRFHKADLLIKHTPKLKLEALIEEGVKAYNDAEEKNKKTKTRTKIKKSNLVTQ